MMKSPAQLYREATNLAPLLNWDDTDLSWRKAYVAAIVSSLTYEYIPQFEIEDTKRARLIPSERYQTRIAEGNPITAEELRLSMEADSPVVVIENRYFVALLTKISDVVFIGLRGTSNIYDVGVDLDIRKTIHPPHTNSLSKLHRGFFDAISSDLGGILRALAKFGDKKTPLYLTGHSLGGALAAILDVLLHYRFNWNTWAPIHSPYVWLRPISTYTFGMPRYGNRYAVSYYRTPFHIYNQNDLVPTFPPRILGYSDIPIDYCLNSYAKLVSHYVKGSAGLRYSSRKLEILSAAEHKMERYLSQTELASQFGVG